MEESLLNDSFQCHQTLSPEYEYHFYELKIAEIEKGFNKFGHYPLISTITGIGRMAIATAAIYLETYIVIPGVLCYNLVTKEPKDVLYAPIKHCSYLVQAYANGIRGIVECIPLAGNLTTYSYDRWAGRISYLAEKR